MDAALYQRLLPYVCALADETLQVNINTLQPAQAALLASLFPAELTLAEARQLLQARSATGWSSVAAFLSQPLLQKTDTAAARPWLAVHSERFIATFSVVMGSARYQQRSLLQKQGRTFSVVQRRYGIYWVADE